MDHIWYFEQVDLIAILCPNKFGNYAGNHEIKSYEKEDFVYFSEDPAKNIFLISKGKVKILNYTESGEIVVKSILTKGDIFGEMVLLGEEKRTDYAQVIENDTMVCQMDIGQLEGLMLENKKFALTINKIIGLRIKKLERRLDALVFKDVRTRLVEFIKDLSQESGTEKERGILVSHFYTHKDMADLIGTTRQTVTTILNELKQEGMLEFKRKEIFIPDPGALG